MTTKHRQTPAEKLMVLSTEVVHLRAQLAARDAELAKALERIVQLESGIAAGASAQIGREVLMGQILLEAQNEFAQERAARQVAEAGAATLRAAILPYIEWHGPASDHDFGELEYQGRDIDADLNRALAAKDPGADLRAAIRAMLQATDAMLMDEWTHSDGRAYDECVEAWHVAVDALRPMAEMKEEA